MFHHFDAIDRQSRDPECAHVHRLSIFCVQMLIFKFSEDTCFALLTTVVSRLKKTAMHKKSRDAFLQCSCYSTLANVSMNLTFTLDIIFQSLVFVGVNMREAVSVVGRLRAFNRQYRLASVACLKVHLLRLILTATDYPQCYFINSFSHLELWHRAGDE